MITTRHVTGLFLARYPAARREYLDRALADGRSYIVQAGRDWVAIALAKAQDCEVGEVTQEPLETEEDGVGVYCSAAKTTRHFQRVTLDLGPQAPSGNLTFWERVR